MSHLMRVADADVERLKKYAKVYETRGKAVHRVLNLAEQVTDEVWLVEVLEQGLAEADGSHLGGLDQVPTHQIAKILARTVAAAARATCQEQGVSDGNSELAS